MNYYPKRVVWELTNACNAKCIHCGSKSGVQRENELTEAEALRVCDELKDLGSQHVTLMGGEFFLAPHWESVCRRLIENGIQVGPLSNGLLLNEKNLTKLKDMGLKAVYVSIDGIGETHDFLRGVPGLYEKLIINVKKAKEMGFILGVNTAISALNWNELDDLHELLKELDASIWQFQLVENVGNAFKNEQLRLSMADIYEIAKKIAKYRQHSFIRVEAADNIGYFCLFEPLLRKHPFTGCAAGRSVLGIHANGDIRGCLSVMCTNETIEGNLRQRPLREIWEDPNCFSVYRYRTVDKLTGFCAKCEYRDLCRAGCSGMAYSLTGSFYDNPFCLHRYEVENGIKDGDFLDIVGQ